MTSEQKRHLLTAWQRLWSHEPQSEAETFFAMLGQSTRTVRRAVRLYARMVGAFHRAGATWREAIVLPFAVPAALGGSTWINDLASNVVGGVALASALRTDGAVAGLAVDMSEAFGNVFAIAVSATVTDGTYAIKMQEDPASGGTYVDIAGATMSLVATDDNGLKFLTFRRTKRFVRAHITVAASTTGGTVGVIVLGMKKAG
jgi:hypothetical protein